MNVKIRRIEPTTTEPEAWLGYQALEPANVWEEETEHADYAPRPLAGRSRRLWLGVVAIAIVAGVGFAGRFLPDDHRELPGSGSAGGTTPAVGLPFTITSPEANGTIKGATIDVSGTADESVTNIHLGVVVGGAVIGWTTVQVDRAGSWSTSIPVFAPPVGVEAQLLASPDRSRRAGPAHGAADGGDGGHPTDILASFRWADRDLDSDSGRICGDHDRLGQRLGPGRHRARRHPPDGS